MRLDECEVLIHNVSLRLDGLKNGQIVWIRDLALTLNLAAMCSTIVYLNM